MNCFANGLLNMPGGVKGFINVFDLMEEELKYDADKKAAEIAAAEIDSNLFSAIKNLDIYKKNKLDWLEVSVVRGMVDVEELMNLYEYCLPFFVEN